MEPCGQYLRIITPRRACAVRCKKSFSRSKPHQGPYTYKTRSDRSGKVIGERVQNKQQVDDVEAAGCIVGELAEVVVHNLQGAYRLVTWVLNT